ncbi:MAG: 3-hydroxyacyl-CoA dehydrogenase family protein [Chloroflexia bacterium]|nr:3-hydroxyacyl-CoA dehydrogenase family protein [Chloroflexia bacterium]
MSETALNASADIMTVAVIGAGTLGAQIAAMTAASGRDVLLFDVVDGAAVASIDRLRAMLEPVVAGGNLDWDLDAVLNRIEPVATLARAVADAHLVIEAVRENLATKRALFAEIDAINSHPLLATNSSSIPSSKLADVVSDPGKLVNLHFFSAFWSRACVELMGCGQTTGETMATMAAFGQSLGLFTAVVRGESKGFIVNRIWRAVKRESLAVVDQGHADPEDVDRLWAFFWGIDYGPFGMMDHVGLDVIADIEDSYIAVSHDPTDVPSPALHALVDAGHLGEKTGSGFYEYPNPPFRKPGWPRSSKRSLDEPD